MQPQIDWLAYVSHLLQLSLLSIGGVITVIPDMHRVFVAGMGLVTTLSSPRRSPSRRPRLGRMYCSLL